MKLVNVHLVWVVTKGRDVFGQGVLHLSEDITFNGHFVLYQLYFELGLQNFTTQVVS